MRIHSFSENSCSEALKFSVSGETNLWPTNPATRLHCRPLGILRSVIPSRKVPHKGSHSLQVEPTWRHPTVLGNNIHFFFISSHITTLMEYPWIFHRLLISVQTNVDDTWSVCFLSSIHNEATFNRIHFLPLDYKIIRIYY